MNQTTVREDRLRGQFAIRLWKRLVICMSLLVVIGSLPGCSLFVLAGKVFMGDPMVEAHFKQMTSIDLTKADRKALIVCSAPELVNSDFPSIKHDLTDGVIRRLKLKGVLVVDPDEVSTWIDDNGGTWDEPSELARRFDTDYIVHIDLDDFSYIEKNASTFYRGRARGNLFVYSVDRKADLIDTLQIYVKEFTSEYPAHQPMPASEISEKLFYKRYLDRISQQIAQSFYDHKASDNIY